MTSPFLSRDRIIQILTIAALGVSGVVYNSMAEDLKEAKAKAADNEKAVIVLETKLDAANDKLDDQKEQMQDQNQTLQAIYRMMQERQ